ncbi:MAG TPA: hypothetical protein DEO65_03195 [Bacillus bacterium]|nr:hypothetical protein [Bacillus sp. (in: firmicutes)]
MALDQEWVELIMLAKQMGLTMEEVREFLFKAQVRTEKITG